MKAWTCCILVTAVLLCVGPDAWPQSAKKNGGAPTLDQALAWMKKLPPVEGLPADRFEKLTVEDLKAMTDFRYGGHTKAGPHVATPAAEFRHLAALPALRKLDLLENDGVNDEAMSHIGKVGTLTYLDFGGGGAQVTPAGMRHLAGLKELTFLGMAGNARRIKVGIDAGLPAVAALPKLEVLVLGNTLVTDAGLAALAKCPALKELHLPMTDVTDAGLASLASIRTLAKVAFDKQTKVTPQGIARLEKALPGCKVVLN